MILIVYINLFTLLQLSKFDRRSTSTSLITLIVSISSKFEIICQKSEWKKKKKGKEVN